MTGQPRARPHVRGRAARSPSRTAVSVGLLGADYRVADGRYQFARILAGENWNPKLQAPLTQPGVSVQGGRVPPRRERPGPARRRRRLPPVPGHGRQADRAHRRARAPTARARAQVTVVPVAVRRGAAPAHLDGGQPPPGGRADRRPRGLRLHPGHRSPAGSPTSTATSSPRSARRRSSSTSASTTAATSPTTSWTT